MPHDGKQDLIAIREWMSKEPHLPQDLFSDDQLLYRFLHTCYFSLEGTKKYIDKFCTTRALMPEVYTRRDPLLPDVKNIIDRTAIATYPFQDKEAIFFKFDEPTPENFLFYDFLKTVGIHKDAWITFHPHYADEHYVVIDLSFVSLKLIPKLNIVYLRDFLMFLLESMPIRVKKIIGIKAPSYYEKVYSLIRPILPSEVIDIIHIHTNVESLYQYMDQKYVPVEYGGGAGSFHKQSEEWRKKNR
uniref:CTD38 n=1 Tax=Heliconius melpomene TaxID=34740 RepID=A0A2H4RMS0_HELME|nr:CTD38 [Heliconius melpomene]